jgi:hypothetical protein
MCNMYMEPDPISKQDSKILEFEKKSVKIETK